MAQSLTLLASIKNATRGTLSGTKLAKTIATAGDNFSDTILDVTTTEVAYTVPTQIGNAGYCTVENLDATNYVEMGYATTVYSHRFDALEPGVFKLQPTVTTLYFKANTATCKFRVCIYEK